MSSKSGSSVADLARAARVAAVPLALAGRATKDAALLQMATALREHTDDILQANKEDVVRAEAAGTDAAMIDRLRLDAGRIDAMAAGLE
ncbi:MAG TPA: gamma-glutamyl-phosphate reductase, partial [Actinopolymorphaceae bacterium]